MRMMYPPVNGYEICKVKEAEEAGVEESELD